MEGLAQLHAAVAADAVFFRDEQADEAEADGEDQQQRKDDPARG